MSSQDRSAAPHMRLLPFLPDHKIGSHRRAVKLSQQRRIRHKGRLDAVKRRAFTVARITQAVFLNGLDIRSNSSSISLILNCRSISKINSRKWIESNSRSHPSHAASSCKSAAFLPLIRKQLIIICFNCPAICILATLVFAKIVGRMENGGLSQDRISL